MIKRKTLEFPANPNAKPPRTAAVVASLFPLRYESKKNMMRRETLVPSNANSEAAVANPLLTVATPQRAASTIPVNMRVEDASTIPVKMRRREGLQNITSTIPVKMRRRERLQNITYAKAFAAPPDAASAKPTGSDGRSALKRLQSELMSLMMCEDLGISVFPQDNNIFIWKGTIKGSKDTVYEGMVYKLLLAFPNDYPFKPPKVKFETPCFHPNVDLYGNICSDILQDKWWSAAYGVRTILLSIQNLLGEPDNDSPLNNQAAAFWANQEEFKKKVEELYETVY